MTNAENFTYQVGGSLPADAPSYVERQCDREYYDLLKESKYCYVFNCRQMGKSSLRVRVTHKLQAEGTVCATIDPQKIGVEVTCEQWYASAIRSLVGDLNLKGKFDLRSWIKEREMLSPVQRFAEFIEVVLQEVDTPIVIFVEEIDRLLSLKFGMDDFFGLVRSLFEDRPIKPEYNRLTFSFLGVATPTDLIQSNKTSGFNIGYAVEMSGFTFEEALPLMQGLARKVANPRDYLAAAVSWTGGQPFLIQRLLGIIEKELDGVTLPENIADWVEGLVQERIVTNWESQDAPPHLTTIRDRVISVEEKLRGRMLGCYQQVLADGELDDDRSEERSKLRLTGLVVRRDGKLRSYNSIYGAVFNNAWVEDLLADLRPDFYGSAFRAWREAELGQNQDFLLRGQALADGEEWARGKRLSDADEKFLYGSRKIEKLETKSRLEAESLARKTVEEANQILSKAQQKANQRIKNAWLILVGTLFASGVIASLAISNFKKAENKIQEQSIKLSGITDDLRKQKNNLRDIWELSESEANRLQGKYDNALKILNKIIENNPYNNTALISRGFNYANKKNYIDAEADFKAALRLDDRDPITHYNLGNVLYEQNKLEEAIIAYRKAIALNPKHAYSYNGLAKSLYGQNKPEEAVLAYRQAIELNPEYAYAYNDLGEALRYQNKLEEAITAYRKMITLAPKDALAYGNLCWTSSLAQQTQNVLQICEKAVELSPLNDKDFYRDSRGLAKAMIGDTDGAIDDFKAYMKWLNTSDYYKDSVKAKYKIKRQQWIDELRSGKTPAEIFTKETLEQLRKE